ncbi:hypothetical protein L917_16143 [Phytophthora nicotianae]|uniref:Uncharacterized protein n=1 Tax=Phytophthora nicotianae TaxID=4792 RepID=W2KFF7_PHYNI|nr:hypothetical protein L917_16143 [Phytophthora nicotianae]
MAVQTHPENVKDSGALNRESSFLSRVENKWNAIQVGRQGEYSIERVESLDHYCKTASKTRVLLVCILTPVPALAVAIMLEMMPLQDPSKGWDANWIFWIRLTVIIFILTCMGMFQLRRLVLGLPVTFGKIMTISSVVSAIFTGFAVLLAALVGFPVPFVMVVGGIPFAITLGVVLVLMFGIAPFRYNSPLRVHLAKFLQFLVVRLNLVAIYPLFKVLYAFAPAKSQGFVMLLLPVWKFVAKKYVGRAMRELEDYIPQIVGFNVDYFSTLFVSVCMFSSGSVLMTVLAIVVDIAFSLLEYRELQTNANTVYNLLRDNKNWSKSHLCNHTSEDLLTLLLEVTRNPEAHDVISLPNVRLWACEPHPISSDRLEILKTLATLDVYGFRPAHSTASKAHISFFSKPLRKLQTRHVSVAATGPVSTVVTKSNSLRSPRASVSNTQLIAGADRSETLINQGLQLLFHSEYLLVVEYIECIVPIVFVAYQLVLYQLPNVVYAPGGAEGWQSGAVENILLLIVLEVCSLLVLKVLLERKFAFSPLHQLAYVLETQLEHVQADVFIATIILLPFEINHFGMDFTFQFEWFRATSE